jgi:hypothetical protein
MDELVKRLQDFAAGTMRDEDAQLAFDAADAIERLGKDLERSKEWETFWEKEANEALKKFQATVARMPRWISVEEQLPEYGERVLVFGGFTRYVAYYDKNRYGGESWHKLNSKSHYCNPTHWMPLPEPPKEET